MAVEVFAQVAQEGPAAIDMHIFFEQVIAAASQGIIRAFATHVLCSRH